MTEKEKGRMMGLINRLQTGALVRSDAGLLAQQRKFAALFDARMNSDLEVDYTDGQPGRENDDAHESWRDVRDEADIIFSVFWDDATEAYAVTRSAANMSDHGRFSALLHRQVPYGQYDYRDLLRNHVLGEIVRRRRKLTAHWAA